MASASKEADRLRRLCERSMPAPAPGASAAAAAAAGGLGSLAAPFLTRSTARGVVAAARGRSGAPLRGWRERRGRRAGQELAARGARGALCSRRRRLWRRRRRQQWRWRRSALWPAAPPAGRAGRAWSGAAANPCRRGRGRRCGAWEPKGSLLRLLLAAPDPVVARWEAGAGRGCLDPGPRAIPDPAAAPTLSRPICGEAGVQSPTQTGLSQKHGRARRGCAQRVPPRRVGIRPPTQRPSASHLHPQRSSNRHPHLHIHSATCPADTRTDTPTDPPPHRCGDRHVHGHTQTHAETCKHTQGGRQATPGARPPTRGDSQMPQNPTKVQAGIHSLMHSHLPTDTPEFIHTLIHSDEHTSPDPAHTLCRLPP